MKYYSYDEFRNDVKKLIKMLNGFESDSIIAIARGGLTFAHAVAEGLNIRDVQTLRTELYDETKKREKITVFGECNLEAARNVLVLDDIADSGETLEAVMRQLEIDHPEVTFKVATLFYKKTSVYEPHIWINEANEWIDFFWERDFKG